MSHTIVKHWMLNFIIGGLFLVLSLITFAVMSNAIHTQMSGSYIDIAKGISQGNGALVGMAFLGLFLEGIIVWITAWVAHWIGKEMKLGTPEPKVGHQKILMLILTFIGLGFVASFIFAGFQNFVMAMSPGTNLASLNSLASAFASGNFVLGAVMYFVIAVYGLLVLISAHAIPQIEKRVPKQIR